MLTEMYVKASLLKEDVKDRVLGTLRRLREEEEGASMVEYALLVAGISVALIAAVGALYSAIQGAFTNVTTAINDAGTQ